MVRTKHRIGRYRVIAPIGAGGFSTVYRALDEESDHEVAIKVLAENHSMVPETRRRFVDEFNLRATVESPYIARMYEVGIVEETGQPYMVLELASRGDLRRRVEEIRRSHQVLTQADLLMLARHLTEALTALHKADIVHRDVSPGNILIRSHPSSGARQGSLERGNVTLLEPGERFLLADLGHAKDLIRSSGFTAGGGTQGFSAPEQRDDVTVIDHRADIFSATAIIEWAAHDGLYAEALESFCDVGLAEDPEDRFASMSDWYESISQALGVERDNPSRGRRWGRHRRRDRDRDNGHVAVGRPGGWGPFGRAGRREEGLRPPVHPPGPHSDPLEPEGRRSRIGLVMAALAVVVVGVALGLAAADRTSLLDLGLDRDRAGGAPTSRETGALATERVEDTATADEGPGPLRVEPAPGERPWVALAAPMDRAVIEGDLLIGGDAHHVGGIAHVELTVQHVDSGRYWTPTGGLVPGDANPILVGVTGVDVSDPTTGRFELVIADGELEPGEYLIQVWARGPDEEGQTAGTDGVGEGEGVEEAEPTIRTVTLR